MKTDDGYWWYVTVRAEAGRDDDLFSLADISGSIGTELQEFPDGSSKIRIYYGSREGIAYWKNRLTEAMKGFPWTEIEDWGKIENQPWNVVSEEAFPPLPVGRGLVVLAPWHKGKEPAGRIPLYINPGSAFGTGYHESTQIVLELLEDIIKPGMSVADIGTGSGILSIGALKLGAAKVYARDIDPAVIEEVRKNFALNGLDGADADIAEGDLLKDFSEKTDVLTANILLDPLTTMVCDVPRVIGIDGTAVFSGMLEKEKPAFMKALEKAGMAPVKELVKGEWWGVSAKVKA